MKKTSIEKIKSFFKYILFNILFCFYFFILDTEINKIYSDDYQFGFVKNVEFFESYHYIKYFIAIYGTFAMNNIFYKINSSNFLLKIYLSIVNIIILLLFYFGLKKYILCKIYFFNQYYTFFDILIVLIILPILCIFINNFSYILYIRYKFIYKNKFNYFYFITKKIKFIIYLIKYPVIGHMIYIIFCLLIGIINEFYKEFLFLETIFVLKNNQNENIIPYYIFTNFTSLPACFLLIKTNNRLILFKIILYLFLVFLFTSIFLLLRNYISFKNFDRILIYFNILIITPFATFLSFKLILNKYFIYFYKLK